MLRTRFSFLTAILAVAGRCAAFTTAPSAVSTRVLGLSQVPSSNAVLSRRPSRDMKMAKSGEEAERALANMARAARKVGPNDRVVELRKPMGLVLEEDERGNVYIVDVVPNSNASRKKVINVGDKIAFVSATFGDEIWSAKGVGLSRVQSAIKARSGPFVKLVLESSKEGAKKMERDAANLKKKQEAQESEEDRKDRLLNELSNDTKKQKKKPWYGLF